MVGYEPWPASHMPAHMSTKMSSAKQILKQADSLKTKVADTSGGSNEAWLNRQSLQDLYQSLLLIDLEFALDKKVEQDLWNHAFKNQINTLQTQTKDRQNPKRPEIQSSLDLFLETASGFYIQLLQQICSAFKLDLPFRRRSSHFGVLKEYGPVVSKSKIPRRSSCLYVCQHCLVHLGDIARYRQEIDQAQTYYRHAAMLVPSNGQPYNQLAILEAAKSNKLAVVFFYIRSLAVRHPFPVASTNLDKLYAKIAKESREVRGKLSLNDIIASFLQFHALVHLRSDFERASRECDKITASLPPHITSLSFSSYQLVQMMAINFFAIGHASRKKSSIEKEGKGKQKKSEEKENQEEEKSEGKEEQDKKTPENKGPPEKMSEEETKAYSAVLTLLVTVLDQLVALTPKQEQKTKESQSLPIIKLSLDWIKQDVTLLNKSALNNAKIWPNLAKLFNNLQFHPNQKDSIDFTKLDKVPLPEDYDLQEFLPIQKALCDLQFPQTSRTSLTLEQETRLRCHRLILHGLWISEKFPGLMKVQKLKSGKLQFSSPRAVLTADNANEAIVDIKKGPHSRQNVAIQAIMQKARKTETPISKEENVPVARIMRSVPEKEQPSLQTKILGMPNPETKPPGQETELDNFELPSFALPLKAGQVIVPGMQLTRPASSAPRATHPKPGIEINLGLNAPTINQPPTFTDPRMPGLRNNGSTQSGVPPQMSSGTDMQSIRGQGVLTNIPGTYSASPQRNMDVHPTIRVNQPSDPSLVISGNQLRYPPPGQIGPVPKTTEEPRSRVLNQSPLRGLGGFMPMGGLQPSAAQSTYAPFSGHRQSPNQVLYSNQNRYPSQNMGQNVSQNHFMSMKETPDYLGKPSDVMNSNIPSSILLNLAGEKMRQNPRPSTQPSNIPFISQQQILDSLKEASSNQAPENMGDIFALLGRQAKRSPNDSPIPRHSPNMYAAISNFNKPEEGLSGLGNIRPHASGLPLPVERSVEQGLFSPQQIPGDPSPATGRGLNIEGASLFSQSPTSNKSVVTDSTQASTYQLFSQSPWSVQLTPKDTTKSHSPSPFSSAQSSLRTTPDPYTMAPDSFSSTPEPTSDLSYKYGAPASGDAVWMTQGRTMTSGDIPWGPQKGGESSWRPPLGVSPDRAKGQWPTQPPPPPVAPMDVGPSQYQNNIPMWMSGPSPLEKLLEQQKQQRHGEPH